MNLLEGKEVTVKQDLLDIFQATEGSINMYYGKIGHGKTYAATADILDLLKEGKVVYANWHIIVDDFDDRYDFMMSLKNFLFFRKRYFKIPCSQNLHYFDPENFSSTGELVEWLSNLNDCHIFFDEGQDMFDSYEGTKFSKAKRRLSDLPTGIYLASHSKCGTRRYLIVSTRKWQINPTKSRLPRIQSRTTNSVLKRVIN